MFLLPSGGGIIFGGASTLSIGLLLCPSNRVGCRRRRRKTQWVEEVSSSDDREWKDKQSAGGGWRASSAF